MTHLSIVASVLTMAAIAMERYFPPLLFQYLILEELNKQLSLNVWFLRCGKLLSFEELHI